MTPGAASERLKLTPEQRRALIDDTLAMEARIAKAAAGDFEAWLQAYLPEDFYAPAGEFHRSIYADLVAMMEGREIEGETRDSAAFAYPRGHGKTTTITKGFALWVLANWRRLPHFKGRPPFILLVSDTAGQARDRALDLRDELEGNEAFRRDYGDQARLHEVKGARRSRGRAGRSARKWTETDFTLADGSRVLAVGAGSKVRGLLRKGRRPTLILCDDLENDERVVTKEQRRKLERWLQKALIPTGIQGTVATIVVGTILHADSLLARLLSRDNYDGWLKRRYAALYNEAGLPSPDGERPLWPEFWTLQMLLARRRAIGSIAFAQEYLNQPVDDETALFRWEWMQAAMRRGKGVRFLYGRAPRIGFHQAIGTWDPVELAEGADAGAYQVVITAWDLSIVDTEKRAQERDSDYTVGVTVGLTCDDRIEVRRIYRARGLTPAKLRARVIAEQNLIGADYVIVENNAAQKIHEIDLRGQPNMPIRGHTTDRKKHDVYEGVPGLGLLFELGRISLCWGDQRERRRLEDLTRELHGLGVEAHDDCVMALWMAVVNVRKWQRVRDTRRRKLIGPPPDTYVDPFPGREPARRAA